MERIARWEFVASVGGHFYAAGTSAAARARGVLDDRDGRRHVRTLHDAQPVAGRTLGRVRVAIVNLLPRLPPSNWLRGLACRIQARGRVPLRGQLRAARTPTRGDGARVSKCFHASRQPQRGLLLQHPGDRPRHRRRRRVCGVQAGERRGDLRGGNHVHGGFGANKELLGRYYPRLPARATGLVHRHGRSRRRRDRDGTGYRRRHRRLRSRLLLVTPASRAISRSVGRVGS